MIHYADMTFCQGAGCQARKTCPRYLTKEIIKRAAAADLPIACFDDPTSLRCYVKPDKVRPGCKHAFKHSTPEERLEVCRYAANTTSAMAAIKFNRSDGMVRRWMRALGIPRRRVGALTDKETMMIKEAA